MSINVYPAADQSADPWIQQAKRIILADYGDSVTLEAKNKNLLKFGRSQQVQTVSTSLMTLPSGTYNETYVASNLITSIISTSGSDTESVTVEGHTVSGGDFTFSTQTLNLTGQTVATLATPLARVTRAYNADSTELVGTVSVTEDDTYTSGVPDTDSLVHLQIRAGEQQSEKASTTISSIDYWVVTSFYADMLEKTAASADVDLEIRLSGGVFRPVADISCSENHRGQFAFSPYLIVPPNADIRLRARASANGKDVSGGIEGVLLKA
jgi:hypothetical protein